MTTTLDRPQSLEELPTVIQELQHTPLQLDQIQEEYKRQIGLSGKTHSTFHFHPKALQQELKAQKEHFHNVKNNYINHLTKQKFLECMLQEPQIDITTNDLLHIENENKRLLSEINSYTLQIESLGERIKTIIQAIEQRKTEMMDTVDETEKTIANVLTMEEEVHRIKAKLSNQSELTLEEAEEILSRQTANLTKLNNLNNEKKEAIEEHRWLVQQKEKEVDELKIYADQMENEANQAIKVKQDQNEDIECQYREYKEGIEMYNRILFGAKEIDFSSEDVIHVTFDSKYKEAVLHIYIDYEKRRVAHATIDGPHIDLDKIIKMVQSISVNHGVRTMILETLACLKKL